MQLMTEMRKWRQTKGRSKIINFVLFFTIINFHNVFIKKMYQNNLAFFCQNQVCCLQNRIYVTYSSLCQGI